MLTSKQIRAEFIRFFEEKGHTFVPSAPVVPQDDPTLLFTNAGMNQFKPIFLGQKVAQYPRAVNSQKCIRAGGKHNDLEEVGKDGYHHTFFEMLGNWSFGDYYKKEAISWAWELLTQIYKFPKDKLYATVHHSDLDAYKLWKEETDIIPDHITYHGDKDNFWEMGDTGPCGPCSEIHFDRGPDSCERAGEPDHVCEVNGNCSRYIELWNLVFIQFNRDTNGDLHLLESVFVDTGGGLERFCQILQGVRSNYDTDLFQPIIQKIASLSGVSYTDETGVSHRVIADHIRTLCFALADGGFPSNEGRGYVLRRILRRASRHGRLLGFVEPFLWKLVDVVNEVMGEHFTELAGKESFIKMVIKAEEERFIKTLDMGLTRFEEIIKTTDGQIISGADAFILYDTYGFPPDLTQIIAEERGYTIDLEGFNNEMNAQRERARSASRFVANTDEEDWTVISENSDSRFEGYDSLIIKSTIVQYSIKESGEVAFILDRTPFYAESGGQVGDTGKVSNADLEIQVTNTRKVNEKYIHYGILLRGIVTGDEVTAEVDSQRRRAITRNHTATHLLHKALRSVLGEQVQQKGSLVTPDYLRFDFTHIKAMSHDELRKVERLVYEQVILDLPVSTKVMDLAEAKSLGAMALFGEKYGDNVRVVSVQDFSRELCGGTHVSSTGEIGLFKILSEGSSAAGIRRIEAVTGLPAYETTLRQEDEMSQLADLLSTSPKKLKEKIEVVLQKADKLESELKTLTEKQISSEIDGFISSATSQDGFALVAKILPADADLRLYAEMIHTKAKNTIAVFFNKKDEDSVSMVCAVTPDLQTRFNAGNLVKNLAGEFDGKGGGRMDTAQAGGKHPERLNEVIRKLPELIKQ